MCTFTFFKCTDLVKPPSSQKICLKFPLSISPCIFCSLKLGDGQYVFVPIAKQDIIITGTIYESLARIIAKSLLVILLSLRYL